MKSNLKIQKKIHFNFKNSKSFQKHILKFGTFGFKLVTTLCVMQIQEEFFKFFILKKIKIFTSKKIKIFFSSNCFYSKTKLPLETRMGKGKGEIFCAFSYYKKGFIFFELAEISIQNVIKLKQCLNKKKLKFSLI